MFKKATKAESKLRLAINGVSGSGKTYTSLKIATGLTPGKVAVIDTERGSASKYADIFDFDVLELNHYHPQKYIDAIRTACKAGYQSIVIDSLSHAWMGEGGALDLVEEAASRAKSHNTFAAWKNVTPLHRQLIDTMLGAKAHIIATMRTKHDYLHVKDEKGSTVIKKVGTTAVQREGMEYEFDLVGELDLDNKMVIEKSRCSALKGVVIHQPGEELVKSLKGWLCGEVQTTSEPIKEEPLPIDKAVLNNSPEEVEPWNELEPEPAKSEQKVKTISEAQATRILAIACGTKSKPRSDAWTFDQVKDYIQSIGYETRKDIPVGEIYDNICEFLEKTPGH